jgi:hypothetical protein
MLLAIWPLLVAAGSSAAAGVPPNFHIHNPHGVQVTAVHVVQSAHFDGGCKTFGCSAKLLAGEPDRCAQHHAEPYSYHIVNRWFDEYFLRAVAYANQSRGSSTPYRHMSQPWLLSLFFDCENAGMLSWPGAGWATENTPTLHCPNSSTVAEVRGALVRGDIFFHAFPHDGEASAFPDAELFDAALGVSRQLSAKLGLPMSTAVSTRDVPGWSRATIPLLARRGINGMSFGAGTPPGKPDTPPLFVWKDLPSGTDAVVTYESRYGDIKTVFVLPNGVALVANFGARLNSTQRIHWQAWHLSMTEPIMRAAAELMHRRGVRAAGDNTGPGAVDLLRNDTLALRSEFPGATVISSTFDAFFNIANQVQQLRQPQPVEQSQANVARPS